MSQYHIPVMPHEVLQYLNVKRDAWYIDCNLGGGGHTELILQHGGRVLGIDLDRDAIQEVARKYKINLQIKNNHLVGNSSRLILYQSNFSQLSQITQIFHIHQIQGILFDLGVSSHQLEEASRGFSFNLNAPLDMRMDQQIGAKAEDLVNGLNEGELVKLFSKLGEEIFAKSIAKKIIEARKGQPITTTNQLAQIILSVRHRSATDPTHPATRVFQALRIAVNDELNSLQLALPQTVDLLVPGGRLVIISFHSLEDRIVKNFFKQEQRKGDLHILTEKPITPALAEIQANPRSHSGKLRAAEKTNTR
ncbi:MAG: 16S rRNA (cytosine(1402)-N(4))-methyltransferase RsmH [Patescibacteria group bacterium]|nr:16S rRNA (cytosine(1402)-N(4))-methyltransferase RsmH [Patescibacteria group bacterium]